MRSVHSEIRRREGETILSDERGIAREAAIAFTTLIVIAITWNILFPSLEEHVFEYAENEYKQNNDFTQYESTYQLIYFVAKYWPIIMLIAVLLYLFMASQTPTRGQYTGRR
jgi:hypothetical protein